MKLIKYYPYRTARVQDITVSLPREVLDKLEQDLAAQAGQYRDNHTCYTFIDERHKERTAFFTDLVVHFGTVVEGKY